MIIEDERDEAEAVDFDYEQIDEISQFVQLITKELCFPNRSHPCCQGTF